jgi:hypothetical protein
VVNATVSWDLRGWAIKRNAVYKLPWCPLCGERDRVEQLGSIGFETVQACASAVFIRSG